MRISIAVLLLIKGAHGRIPNLEIPVLVPDDNIRGIQLGLNIQSERLGGGRGRGGGGTAREVLVEEVTAYVCGTVTLTCAARGCRPSLGHCVDKLK